MVNFVEICNVCARKAIIEAAKRIINSDKVCHSYSDLNFGITFLEHSVESFLFFYSVIFIHKLDIISKEYVIKLQMFSATILQNNIKIGQYSTE